MKIYTSYFAKLKKIPKDIVPIAVCGKVPDWYDGLRIKELAPKYSWWIKWKNENHDNDLFRKLYYETVLDILNVDDIVNRLSEMSNGKDVALICYEKPKDFCHRHIIAEWLNKGGYLCEELERYE